MAFEEELHKLKHNVKEALHDVEEVFQDVKEHVLLSVRGHTYVIAFVLMAVTSAILVFGTIYVWCFHHGRPHPQEKESKPKAKQPKKESRLKEPKKRDQKCNSESPTTQNETIEEPEESSTILLDSNQSEKQNGDLRMRNVNRASELSDSSPLKENNSPPSSPVSTSPNNNESPVKSKIPVRRQKSKPS